MTFWRPRGLSALLALPVLIGAASAQENRITRAIDTQQRSILSGNIHPKATAENDQGRVAPSMQLTYVTLMLAQSENQQADLDQLLTEQQTPDSPNYHRWLEPEEYAQRFGVTSDDLHKITAWLEGQGLSIAAVARGRNWIAVNGDAASIENAFQTEIHEYVSGGEKHFANALEPSVPAALAGVVRTIRGLNDFRMKPAKRILRSPLSDQAMAPRNTSNRGEHFLAPNDVATIYNITPLYTAGINGGGQALVIPGQTRLNLSDIRQFRTSFGLAANDPQTLLVPGAKDPGIITDDLQESDLDLEWSGAVARNAKIIFVYSSDVMESVQYAIDQKLAPVLSQSYGACEPETPRSDALAIRALAKQANAEGITWFAASGDAGGADCDDAQNSGLAVDLPASVPEVTGMGGTEFQEGSGQYWNLQNDASGASARSYIPETTWNDGTIDGDPSAGGGGASKYFAKPSWQVGAGVPNDNARDVPDISLSASADHDGYFVYTGGKLEVFGGTSVSAPVFAGVATLLNQYLVSSGVQPAPGLGNMNVRLYSLAQTAPEAFHDITTGDNIATASCTPKSATCSAKPVGFSAGKGYDQATGLGSVDVDKLITAWHSGTVNALPSTTSMTLLSNLHTVAATDTAFLIATVTGANGVTPAGQVQFSVGGVSLGSATLSGSGGIATATLTVNGSQLPAGSGTISAVYDVGSSSVTASVTVSVSSTGSSNGTPVVLAIANGASFQHAYAPGMLLSVFGTQLAPSSAAASSVPLPISAEGVAVTVNGVAAPLYYVSQDQLNIQIPYGTAVNTPATLRINNNGLVTSFPLTIAATAPGIFTDQNNGIVPIGSATRGGNVTLFLTGAGIVNPEIATGAAPVLGTLVTNLPKPAQSAIVKVGGVQASVEFIGIPWSLVGVTQINFKVPSSVATGTQPVVVSVGGVPSAPASLTITN